MAFGILYDPNSTPVANRIVRTAKSVDTLEWLSQPNSVANPETEGEIDWSAAKWDGTKVVNLTAEELASEADAARVASWQSSTIAHFNSITSEQRRPR